MRQVLSTGSRRGNPSGARRGGRPAAAADPLPGTGAASGSPANAPDTAPVASQRVPRRLPAGPGAAIRRRSGRAARRRQASSRSRISVATNRPAPGGRVIPPGLEARPRPPGGSAAVRSAGRSCGEVVTAASSRISVATSRPTTNRPTNDRPAPGGRVNLPGIEARPRPSGSVTDPVSGCSLRAPAAFGGPERCPGVRRRSGWGGSRRGVPPRHRRGSRWRRTARPPAAGRSRRASMPDPDHPEDRRPSGRRGGRAARRRYRGIVEDFGGDEPPDNEPPDSRRQGDPAGHRGPTSTVRVGDRPRIRPQSPGARGLRRPGAPSRGQASKRAGR